MAGEYAAELAEQALDRSLNVMIFSDNVTLDDEIRLKRRARDKGLLVMGPDCGTAMIANTPLAFANVMPEGNIGVIGASGTGIQELCSQIALAGRDYPCHRAWRTRFERRGRRDQRANGTGHTQRG